MTQLWNIEQRTDLAVEHRAAVDIEQNRVLYRADCDTAVEYRDQTLD